MVSLEPPACWCSVLNPSCAGEDDICAKAVSSNRSNQIPWRKVHGTEQDRMVAVGLKLECVTSASVRMFGCALGYDATVYKERA